MDKQRFDTLEVAEVFDWYNGPILFTVKDKDGVLFLCVYCNETETTGEWLYAEVTNVILGGLKAGLVDLYTAFTSSPHVFKVIMPNGTILNILAQDIPEDELPVKGTYL